MADLWHCVLRVCVVAIRTINSVFVCFDHDGLGDVGLVNWPVKIVPEMTYYVSSVT